MAVGYAQVVLGDTPASYWRLGDLVNGSSAADSGSGAIAGTYSGQLSRGMPGAVMGDQDSCVFFLNGHVDMGNSYAFTGTAAFSIEAWVQLQQLPSGGSISTVAGYFFNDGNGSEGWGISIENNGGIEFFRFVSNAGDVVSTAANSMPIGQWVHMVATYDGATMTLYINGVSAGSAASTRSITAGSSVSFQIAHDNTGSQLVGMVDECAVYNYALTATQVANHYNAAYFLTNAPTYLAAKSDGSQVAQAGQINQYLGLHSLTVHNTGTLQVGTQGLNATPGTTWSLATQWLDQPFTLPAHVDTVNRIEVALQCLGSGADVTASLQADSGGLPSGTALASVTIPSQFVPVNRARMVSLPLQATGLTQSGVYHLVLQSAGSSGNTLAAPQGGTGLGTLQTSASGTTWTAQTGVELIVGVYTGDSPPLRNVRESATAWAELESDASGHLVGAYEMVQGSRTAHRLNYSGYGRLTQII